MNRLTGEAPELTGKSHVWEASPRRPSHGEQQHPEHRRLMSDSVSPGNGNGAPPRYMHAVVSS